MNQKLLLSFLFAVIFLVLQLGFGGAVDCNADLSQGGTQCSVSSNLTFNGTYTLNRNSTGAFNHYINFANDFVTLDCNNTRIIGNLTTNGYFINLNKNGSQVKNCIVENWGIGFNLGNNNTILNNVTVINSSTAPVYGTGEKYNFSIYNSTFTRNVSGGRIIYFETGRQYNLLVDGLVSNNSGASGMTSVGCFNCTIKNVISTQLLGSSASFSSGLNFNNVTNNLTLINVTFKGYYYGANFNSGNNFNIYNSTFRENDIGLRFTSVNNVIVSDSTFINNTAGYDGYNLNIWMHNVTNVSLLDLNITEIASAGIFAERSINITITNISCDFIPMSQRSLYDAEDWFEPPSCLQFTPLYKSYTSFASLENTSWNYNDISAWFNQNVTISGTTFDSDTQVYLINEGTTNLQHDLSGYGFVSHRTPNYLKGREDIYYNTAFNNISLFNQTRIVSNNLHSALFNSRKTLYSVFVDYVYYENTMSTSNITELFNKTNALLYNTNGTVCGSTNINNNDGNINCTLGAGESMYVLDIYNLTEGVSRSNSPFTITLTDTSNNEKKYSITSTLVDTVQIPIIVKVNSCDSIKVKLTPKGQAAQYPEFACDSTTLKVTVPSATIAYSTSSNILEILDDTVTTFCGDVSSGFRGMSDSIRISLILVGVIMLLVVLGAGWLVYQQKEAGEIDFKTTIILVAGIGGLIVTTIIALIVIGIMCEINTVI